MKRSEYLIALGIAAAAGTALGLLSDRKDPSKGMLIGAAAGIVAGSVAAGVYEYVSSREKIPFYSSSSPLYEEPDHA
jgi:hypothetical protein